MDPDDAHRGACDPCGDAGTACATVARCALVVLATAALATVLLCALQGEWRCAAVGLVAATEFELSRRLCLCVSLHTAAARSWAAHGPLLPQPVDRVPSLV